MPRLQVVESTNDPTLEGVQALIAATEVADVRVDQVEAGPVAFTGGEIQVRLARSEPQFAVSDDGGQVVVKLGHTLECKAEESEDDALVTTFQVWHVAVFAVQDDLEAPTPDVAAWIQSNVYFLVYPYVRQFFTTLTAAMGLPSVVLGYLRREDWPEFGAGSDDEDRREEQTER